MRRHLLLTLVGSGIVCLVLAGDGWAAAPRAFVSIHGSDTNPCSALEPCRSFNQALTVVQPGGEIVVQDSGGYSSGFTITQSVTIDAGGSDASVISTSSTDLCTINAGATDRVVLRGISFHGASLGLDAINVKQVGSLYVEHCSISEFVFDGVFMVNGGNLFVSDTDVRKCLQGLQVAATGATPANLVAQDCRFSQCSRGVELYTADSASAKGLLSNCTVSMSDLGAFNLFAGSASADLTLTNCRAFGNGAGVVVSADGTGFATVRIASCVVTGNLSGAIQILNSGLGGIASVVGTSPGSNLLDNGSTTSSVTLQ
jgi:hypothetical protein